MAKKKTTKRISRANRASILSTARSKGWTAEEVAKKYGVSKWTVYGWKKRGSGGAKRGGTTRRTMVTSSVTGGITAASLQSEIRAILPTILCEEIASALRGMIGTRGTTKRRRRGGKK